jgi:hypothetical protein
MPPCTLDSGIPAANGPGTHHPHPRQCRRVPGVIEKLPIALGGTRVLSLRYRFRSGRGTKLTRGPSDRCFTDVTESTSDGLAGSIAKKCLPADVRSTRELPFVLMSLAKRSKSRAPSRATRRQRATLSLTVQSLTRLADEPLLRGHGWATVSRQTGGTESCRLATRTESIYWT